MHFQSKPAVAYGVDEALTVLAGVEGDPAGGSMDSLRSMPCRRHHFTVVTDQQKVGVTPWSWQILSSISMEGSARPCSHLLYRLASMPSISAKSLACS